ncbi:D-glycero-alpha-D-manno-heptose-7-phosphate kinase [Clostridium amylolyticum]|uniref:D-glycero-alpha-D-manno-heptose-7-phosphate kinase n=1 Tax=Clostridium amylolyticum TaxID=1121298 RepID=A0A1M6M832_9CLOT|nr:GHMP kinase [Clostridium amylolyticum]SHJ79625.1 D-glycero-alpha-D-manno-heptose-7-phosphate kinase [Clostridium amylolyticum]
MIITRAPFRVSFCGGGSDLPSFYQQFDGCVLSTSIKKYMYITIHPDFYKDSIVLKYSQTEIVKSIEEIKHKIFKQCLSDFNLSGVEISSMADVPAGTGLGSSSTFTVALLHLLYTYQGKFVSKETLAKEACMVEIDKLGEPIGKQDQYAAAYGGLNFYTFNRDGSVKVEPVIMKNQSYKDLEQNLLMFYTGDVRSASKILAEQSSNMKLKDKVKNQLKMCELTKTLKKELESNNIDAMGDILNEGWFLKRELASGISNPVIDDMYTTAREAGASGGKLLGAGGGGFLLFYVDEKNQSNVRKALSPLREMDFHFDNSGSSIIFVDRDSK